MSRVLLRESFGRAFAAALCVIGLSAAAETVSYWDPVAKANKSQSNCVRVTTSTTEFADNTVYYVSPGDNVTCGTIRAVGTAFLILGDGAKLTSNGGIEVSSGNSLTIYGQGLGTGVLEAHGGACCAGIGGRNPNRWAAPYGNAGSVTINGGRIYAYGNEGSAGIGGGTAADGGSVRIRCGSVFASIGGGGALWGRVGADSTVVVTGGSIVGGSVNNRPKDERGNTLYRQTITLADDVEATFTIEGSDYNSARCASISRQLSVFLPSGKYTVNVTKGGKTYPCPLVVNGEDRAYRILGETIDAASAGGTATLPDGTYLPGTVPADKAGITIVAEHPGKAVVEGGGQRRCLTVNAANVTVDGLVLQNGYAANAENGFGGGVYGLNSTVVQNCTVRDCSATNGGGGIANVAKVVRCRILSCRGKNGGGLYRVAEAFASLISKCTATDSGAGAFDTTALSCTFGEGCAMAGNSKACDCLFYRAGWGGVTVDHAYRVDSAEYFRDPAADDYRLGTLTEWELETIKGDPDRGAEYVATKAMDLDGNSLATNRSGIVFFYAGCSASVLPTPTLQELVNRTAPGETCFVPTGIYTRAVIPAEKTGLVIRPKEPGGQVVVNARGEGSCLTVQAANVRIEGLALTNSANAAMAVYGAGLHICAAGCVVSNCTFAGCEARQKGGAVYVSATGGADVRRSTFVGCTATYGGAVHQESGAKVALEGCGFSDCVASEAGGAVCGEDKAGLSARACLFRRCGSHGAGDVAVRQATCSSCTFVARADAAAAVSVADGTLRDCVFVNCAADACDVSDSYAVTDDYFVGGNAAICREKAAACPGDAARGEALLADGVCGFDGRPLAFREGGALVFVAGCSATYPADQAVTLQELIDATPTGETCFVPAGVWTSAAIGRTMALRGVSRETVVVDGKGTKRCLLIGAADVTVANITFANGRAANGGGIGSSDAWTGIVVTNCVFRDCRADSYGGAIRSVRGKVEDCRFEGNSSGSNGGAADNCDILERCVFKDNRADGYGGGVSYCRVRTSLFVGNDSAKGGGGGDGFKNDPSHSFAGQYASCTFVSNTVAGLTDAANSGVSGGAGAVASDCLFYRCGCAATKDNSIVAASDPFADFAGGDFRLRPMTALELYGLAGNQDRGRASAAAGVLGLDLQPLAPTRNGAVFFFAGCYGALPTDETLQEKINRTDAGGTLVLPAGTYTPAVVDKKMSLVGENRATTVIDGQNLAACLKIESADVSVSGLAFRNGCDAAGGAIRSDDANTGLSVSNCTFSACRSTDAAQGGGALAHVRGRVVACSFADNAAANAGGAAYACETFERCVFSNNTAKAGGAVAECRVRTSLFVGNAASARGGAGAGDPDVVPRLGFAGQYYSCTFVGNRANGSAADETSGTDRGTAYDCVFGDCLNGGKSDHSAVAAAEAFVNFRAGDYHLNTNNVFTLYGLTGDANRAADYLRDGVRDLEGQPIVSMRGTVRFFYAGCYRAVPVSKSLQEYIDETPAGGVCEVPGGLYEVAVIPSGKDGMTLRGAGAKGSVVNANGSGRCLLVSSRNVTLEGFAFQNGFAAAGDRGGDGGGVLEDGGTQTLDVRNCRFEQCRAERNGGGLANAKSAEGCTFSACEARSGGGACAVTTANACTFAACRAVNGNGGAALVPDSATGAFADCAFVRCSATADGGAVDAGNADCEIARCTFTDCSAEQSGGGVRTAKTVTDCTFVRCVSGTDGGGVWQVSSLLQGCTFSGCEAGGAGGGAYDVKTAADCSFASCRANGDNGGGIRLSAIKNGVIRGCTFADCVALKYGGGACCRGRTSSDGSAVEDCTFARCTSGLGGGGLDDAGTVLRCVFLQCETKGSGGGLQGAKKAQGCRAETCKAGVNGGGIATVDDLRASLLLGNSAGGKGGGTFEATASSCTFVGNSAGGDPAINAGGKPRNCLFYGNDYPVTNGTSCATAVASDFCDTTKGDYHLSTGGYHLDNLKGTPDSADRATVDMDGIPLVTTADKTADKKEYFYVGCYAFSPVPAKGNVVNVGDNRVHDDSNLLVSLADLLPSVAAKPGDFADSQKRCVIRFADSLVRNGAVSIGLVQSCLEIPACSGYSIVLQPPAGNRLVFDGVGAWRAIHVAPGATLEVNDAEFRNCLANQGGASSLALATEGGAILNHGTLTASNCVFVGNAASGGTKIMPAPTGNGGAIANHGTAVVVDSTFSGNSAANGAAISNASGGRLAVVNSTFTGNHAIKGSSMIGNGGGCGGAVLQLAEDGKTPDTLFVNCTITGNEADGVGGAVYVQGKGGAHAVRFVNTIAVGNVGTPDVELRQSARGRMVTSWYGTRTSPQSASDALWDDTSAVGSKSALDLFAELADDGTTARPAVSSTGQVTFPLVKDLSPKAMCVRHDATWETVLVADAKNATTWTSVRGTDDVPPRLLQAMTVLETDQLGVRLSGTLLGATSATAERKVGPAVPGDADPLRIDSLDEQVVRDAFARLNANPEAYAQGGTVTVTFGDLALGGTVRVTSEIAELTGFTNVTLVVKGPIAFAAAGNCRFFKIGEGNRVVFEDVTFTGGCGGNFGTGAGGAVWGTACDLTCTRCAFRNCTADYGGAVCLDFETCTATFADCTFDDNTASVVGRDVYNDLGCCLRFYDCSIDPNGVVAGLAAEVEHAGADDPDASDAFSRVADAIRALEAGDTLYLLRSDAERTFDETDLPVGVTVKRKYARVVDGVMKVEGGGTVLQEALDLLADGETARVIEMASGRYAPVTVPAGVDNLVIVGTDASSCVIDGSYGGSAARCVDATGTSGLVLSNLTFRSGSATGDGGGVKGAQRVVRCIFEDCSATGSGGGVAGDGSTEVLLSFFEDCAAADGGSVSGVTAVNCTFASTEGSATVVDADSTLKGCLTVNCGATGGTETYAVADPETELDRRSGGCVLRVTAAAKYPANGNRDRAAEEEWTDLFGNPMTQAIAGETRLFAGAFAAEAPDQRLQALVDAAAADGVVEIPAGTYGPARVPAEKGTLVLKPASGAQVTVDGFGFGPALTLDGAATVEGLTITGGVAEKGGGVCAADAATVRACVIAGNRATVSGGGVSGVTAQNCTFVGNAAPSGAAAANSTVRASIGATADQTLSACGTPADWFTAAEGDFTDFAHGDYSIPEANWVRFRTTDGEYARTAYRNRLTDIAGRPLVRRVAGDYVCLAGAYAADYDDTLQRLIDFATGDTVAVPPGSYNPFVVESNGLKVVCADGPETCTVDGAGLFRGANVTGANVTIEGIGFRNCAADSGGGVYGAAANLRIRNCTFTGCTANLCGGAVLATNAMAVVTGCAFTDNAATNLNSAGGALYAANALVAGCFFRGNTAVCAGALVAGAGVRTICCTFAGNTATGMAFAEPASAAFTLEEGLTLADCVLFNDTQTGFGTEGCTLTPAADPFAASGAGDWRLSPGLLAEAVDFGTVRIASVRDAAGIMPGGASLITSLVGEDMLFAGAYGLAVENELQDQIDRASPGDEITVPDGAYLPVVIPADKTGLTLTGSGAAVINGFGRFRCLTVKSSGVTLKGLVFANGASSGSGGGVGGEATVESAVGCTFTNCTAAANGGGIAGVRTIVGCRFLGNRAGASGGGAYQTVRHVIGSLFAFNAAKASSASGQDDGSAGRADHCTFYANVNADGAPDMPDGDFSLSDMDDFDMVDPAGGDFRLRPEAVVEHAVTDDVRATNVLAQGWIGADGEPLARKAGDWAVMTCGAINCWDMTVQAAVDGAAMGDTVEVDEGTYPPLIVGSEKTGVTVRAKDGARVTIDGAGRFRGVTDASRGLTLEGLVITNGIATSYGDFGPNGGGYCGVPGNGATLVGCTVAGCAAPEASGGGVYGADAVISSKVVNNVAANGGGVAGASLVRTSLILRNRAEKTGSTGGFGGGVYGRLAEGKATEVKNCTFVENAADSGTEGSGLYEGVETHNLFYGCGRANVAAGATGVVVAESPFVDLAAGDCRLVRDGFRPLAILDADYAATARAEGWTSPDGDPLVLRVVGQDLLAAGAYAPDLDLRLQQWIDAAQPGDTVEVPDGVYAPVMVDVGDITLVATGAMRTCVIECAGLCRGVTVTKTGVTIVGFTVRNGDMTLWTDVLTDCNGGAIRGCDATTVASNCTFTACKAVNGGATAEMGLVSGCTYRGCTANDCGGGSYGDGMVRCSLFEGNAAATNGAAAVLSALKSCTLVTNAVSEAGGLTVQGGSSDYSVFCGNAVVAGTGNLATNEDFFVTGTRRPTWDAAMTNRIGDAEYVTAAADWTGPDGGKLAFKAGGATAMTVGAYAPTGAEKTVLRVTNLSGNAVELENAADVVAALRPGGLVEVVAIAAEDVAAGGAAVLLAGVAEAANAAFVSKSEPWYSATVRETDGLPALTVGLNGLARPRIDAESTVDFTGSDTEVSVIPSNIRPELWYGLGRSETPTGPFAVEKDGWVQADEKGDLPDPLKAPKSGPCGFYRVFVTDGVTTL